MIYPTVLDLTVLQDSTFELDLVIAQFTKALTVDDTTNVINCTCHDLLENDAIVFSAVDGDLPCGLRAGEIYYVIASGLTENTFKVSTVIGGSEVDFTTISEEATYSFAKPLRLTGYSFDADIRTEFGEAIAATMTCAMTGAEAGRLRLSMTPETTRSLEAGEYVWDLKLKLGTQSFYYAKGALTVESTVSRDVG